MIRTRDGILHCQTSTHCFMIIRDLPLKYTVVSQRPLLLTEDITFSIVTINRSFLHVLLKGDHTLAVHLYIGHNVSLAIHTHIRAQ